EDGEHPDDRRPRAEGRGRAAQDQELRQEIAERDQDDPGRDEPLARHAARSGGARAAALPVRTRLRSLAGEAGLDTVDGLFGGGAATGFLPSLVYVAAAARWITYATPLNLVDWRRTQSALMLTGSPAAERPCSSFGTTV